MYKIEINRNRCGDKGQCIEVCPEGAIKIFSKQKEIKGPIKI